MVRRDTGATLRPDAQADVGGQADVVADRPDGAGPDASVDAGGPDAAESLAVTMPLEVIAPDGASEHTETLVLPTSASADTAYVVLSEAGYDKSLKAETSGYDDMASLRVNGGDWITLSNDQPMAYPERRLGGVWGIRHQVRMFVPIDAPAGDVTVDFRFNGTEGVSSGYRVLEVDLRQGGSADADNPESSGQSVLEGVRFEQPDFARWQAPRGYRNAEAVAAGRQLWRDADIHESPVVDSGLSSSCQGCHAVDGRDLKYFNYSNKSIQARSQFHGLDSTEGKQIAAYIRSLNLGFPDGYGLENCGGRPWNPPYQPGTRTFGESAGTKLSELPVECWAAGAGRKAVLDRDRDMEPYLYEQWQAGNFEWDQHVDIIDIPLAISFELWNGWLPDRAPTDVYGRQRWESSGVYQAYAALKDELEHNDLQTLVDQVDFTKFGPHGGIFGLINDFNTNVQRGKLPEEPDGQPRASVRADAWPFMAAQSIRQWQSVKLLGVSWKYKLEDLGHEVYYEVPRDHGGGRHGSDPDLWFSRDRTSLQKWRGFFDIAPHMSAKFSASWPGAEDGENYHGWRDASAYPSPQDGRPSVGGPVSCTWYATQMILTDGGGVTGSQAPMDWKYNWTLCSDYGGLVGEDPYMYHVLSQVVEQQNAFGSPYAFSFDTTRRGYGVDWPSINPWWRIFDDSAPDMQSTVESEKTLAQVWEPKVWDPLLTAIEAHEQQPWSQGSIEEELIGYARSPENDCSDKRVECQSYTPQLGGQIHAQSGFAHNTFNAMREYHRHDVLDEAMAERIAAVFSAWFSGVPDDVNMTPMEYWMSAYHSQ